MATDTHHANPPQQPDALIRFVDGRREYAPGDRLLASVTVVNRDAAECRSVEVSVLWHTVGKGDEDLYVHSFKRLHGGDAELSAPYEIDVPLPGSPLSYDGVSVKVCWCVRVRLNLGGYRTHSVEAPFRLGRVHAPAAPPAAV